jgi:hypothetical protein
VAERGARAALEVRDGTPRTLPISLAQPPPALIVDWLADR